MGITTSTSCLSSACPPLQRHTPSNIVIHTGHYLGSRAMVPVLGARPSESIVRNMHHALCTLSRLDSIPLLPSWPDTLVVRYTAQQIPFSAITRPSTHSGPGAFAIQPYPHTSSGGIEGRANKSIERLNAPSRTRTPDAGAENAVDFLIHSGAGHAIPGPNQYRAFHTP